MTFMPSIFRRGLATVCILPALAAAALSPGGAGAQSLPEEMFFEGRAAISHVRISTLGENADLAIADLDIGFRPGGSLPIGFSLGMDATTLDTSAGSSTMITLYPALTYGIGEDLELAIGNPRFVSQGSGGYLEHPVFAFSAFTHDNLRVLTGSYSTTLYRFANLDMPLVPFDVQPYGVRLDYERGNLAIGASLHHLSLDGVSPDPDTIALAFRYRLPAAQGADIALAGTIEHVKYSTGGFTQYRLGLTARSGRLAGQIQMGRNGGFIPNTDHTEAHVSWDLTEDLTVRASFLKYRTPIPAFSSTYRGIGVKYGFAKAAHVSASVVKSSGASKPNYEIGIGVSF